MPPEFIYFLTLYRIFRRFLQENQDHNPREDTGFFESVIWGKLYDFQKDAVIGAIRKLEKYNGCIIADSVGLGKTFEALARHQVLPAAQQERPGTVPQAPA